MDTGAWQGTVYGVAESDMIEQLSMHSQSSCAFPALELLFMSQWVSEYLPP